MNRYDEKNNNNKINNINDQENTVVNQEQENKHENKAEISHEQENINVQEIKNDQDSTATTAQTQDALETQDASETTGSQEENTEAAKGEIAEAESVEVKHDEKSINKKKKESFISRILKDRSFKYGSNSIILIVTVCAIAVLVNVIIGFTDVKWDLTPNKLYSISDETEKILESLEKEVIIYGLFDETKIGNNEFVELLKHYDKYPKVTVKYVDPDKNPGILKEIDPYETLTDINKNSFIVKCGNRLKGLDSYDLYSTRFDQSTFQIYRIGSIAEQSFTGAIKYVTADYTPTIYFTTGHDEKEVDDDFSILKQQLMNNNYDVKPINLVTVEKVPEDASVIVVASPQKDLTQSEKDKLEEFLKNGGKAIFMFDYLEMDPQFPQFESLLMEYNVSLNYDKVKENDERRHLPQDQYVVLTNVKGGTLLSNDYSLLLVDSRSLNILKNEKEWIEVTPLAQTSNLAVGERVDKTKGGDIEGPLNLAVAVEHKGWSKISKIAVIGNSRFIEDDARDYFGPYFNNGIVFFLDTVNWMQDKKNEVTIAPKYYKYQYLNITAKQATYMGILVVIILPLIILAAGLVVFLRRRHL